MLDGLMQVTLPTGIWLEGKHHREAGLYPLTGSDESLLLDINGSLSPVQCVTALLTRCMKYLGSIRPVSQDIVRLLTVGDREALLLHLRLLTLGDRLQCVLECANTECKEKLDLDMKVRDLLLPPYTEPAYSHEFEFDEDNKHWKVQFRLPTGYDQEVSMPLGKTNPDAAADELLKRCVSKVIVDGKQVDGWHPVLKQYLPDIMADLDPQAEIMLNMICPNCEHEFSVLLDIASFFFQEIRHRINFLYREVHTLAFYYHWSEAEIMNMSSRKRQIYLRILDEAISKAGS